MKKNHYVRVFLFVKSICVRTIIVDLDFKEYVKIQGFIFK